MKLFAPGIILIFFCLNTAVSQMIPSVSDSIFGRDPLLYNGEKYDYYVPASTEGTQFLDGAEFVAGAVSIKDEYFPVRQLNYDVYNQQIVLKYKNEAGALEVIQLSKAWIRSFQLGDRYFELRTISGDNPQIFQVLGTGNLKVFIRWSKTLKLDIGYSRRYIFSKPVKKSFLQVGSRMAEFNSNKSFVSKFEGDEQASIKKYIKSNHIRVMKASDATMTRLLSYCEEIKN